MADRSQELRAVEALILSKTRNTKSEMFEHIDLLYGEAHDEVDPDLVISKQKNKRTELLFQLFAAIDELTSIRTQIREAHVTLASLFDLVSFLLRLDGAETALDGNFITDTSQVSY
ncbi:unnamed protein product [Strongylus vulgaris]|uniref:Uncharacterized protein n=1 Tax=Strongylus vulgaris TaxID=40348 RepID=A0A3P7LYG4_STRVU|nr:unnamed protein product [Strongylus vulgaris]